MQDAYLDYAMSVIVARALPDVRDGLKPVHRRILYAMHELGLGSSAKFRKSATVVGDVLGKYHPHGDTAVYDSLARMAQDFSMRYPLIHGQGNWGSIDGDAPAAMRYTEAKLMRMAEDMLTDLGKETVDWHDNYDSTRREPTVLPANVPQLLLNGSVGIAVGMATSIPPHNFTEVVDAAAYLIDHPRASVEDLFRFVKGPDFPTGGAIYNEKEIIEAYSKGRGSFVLRGVAEITESKKGVRVGMQIVIKEIPYQVNKSMLIERMAELVKDKKLDGIRDIRDESDKDGLRIVIDLTPSSYPQKVLNKLYKFTDLQKTFYLNMLALTDGIQPQVLSLREVLEEWLKHRRVVIRRRTEFDLREFTKRAHILEGLKRALSKIDRVIRLIKTSPTKEAAHHGLMKKFGFTDVQATAILEMKLQTLAGLERKKIEDELIERARMIKEFTLILKDPKRIETLIKKELAEVKDKYKDERRTKVFASSVGEFREEDLIPQEETIITLTEGGYIKRTHPREYKLQRRGGKGIIGLVTKGEDIVKRFLVTLTHDELLFFTTKGRVYKTAAWEIPEGTRVSRGRALVNFLNLAGDEGVHAVLPFKKEATIKYLVMVTANGIIKKTAGDEFVDVRRSGIIALKLKAADTLRWVAVTSGDDDILLFAKSGKAIRFHERDARPMGRAAAGVKGINLRRGDEVVGMSVIRKGGEGEGTTKRHMLVVTENGYGKRTEVSKFKVQRRGGSGVKAAQITAKTGGAVAGILQENNEEEMIAVSEKGQVIRTNIASISIQGRATQGVRIMKLASGDKLASISFL